MTVKVPRWRHPLQIERNYQVQLVRIVNQWMEVVKQSYIPALDGIIEAANITKPKISTNVKTDGFIHNDGWADSLAQLTNDLRISLKEIPVDGGSALSNIVASETNVFNEQQWFKITKAVFTVPILQQNSWLIDTIDSFVKENITLISKLQTSVVDDIEGIVNRGIKQGKSLANITKEILNGTELEPGRFKKARTRARLIGRDQVSKLNGQLTQLRQNEAGVEKYRWRTAADERVRTGHKAINGKYCNWQDATVYKNTSSKEEKWKQRSSIGAVEKHPGQDFQCRCYPEADFSDLLTE